MSGDIRIQSSRNRGFGVQKTDASAPLCSQLRAVYPRDTHTKMQYALKVPSQVDKYDPTGCLISRRRQGSIIYVPIYVLKMGPGAGNVRLTRYAVCAAGVTPLRR